MDRKVLTTAVLIAILGSCAPPPPGGLGIPAATTTSSTSYSGNILIANNTSRTVVMFDSNMNYIKHVIQLPAANAPASIAYFDADEILVAVEGTPDRAIRVSLTDGSFTTPILDSTNFTGTVKGIARLASGDIISSDATTGAHLEKFTTAGTRVTAGFPFTLLNTLVQIHPLPNGNFVACAAGSGDIVRVYTAAGAGVFAGATATSPAPTLGAAHDGNGCVANSSSQVAVSWSGATDTVRLYAADLSATVWSFTNAGLTTPGPLAVRPNDNILAADSVTGVIYEIGATSGSLVTQYSSPYVDIPNGMLVMP